jgi:cytochrome c-type biogenesis protein CcmH/NrfF
MIRRRAVVALALTAGLALAAGGSASAAPRASLTDIENDVMCVSCHEALAVAQSPQAVAERNFISGLISQGLTKAQIERALVAQYGPAVLGKPPAHGFNLTVYVLPAALLAGGLAVLAVTLPRWRRRSHAQAITSAPGSALSPTDASRLEEDLARFDT